MGQENGNLYFIPWLKQGIGAKLSATNGEPIYGVHASFELVVKFGSSNEA